MRGLRVLAWRIAGMFGRRRREAVLDEELEAIVQLAVDEHVRRGLSPAAARDAARRELGAPVAIKEAYRDQRGLPSVDAIIQDVRSAVRGLLRTPALAGLIVGTIAIAIAANVAIYGVVDAVLLRPLPWAGAERLAWISEGPTDAAAAVGPDLDLWARSTVSFEFLAGITSADVTLSGENAMRVRAVGVSTSIARLFGLPPARGRDFTPDDFLAPPLRGFAIAAAPGQPPRPAILGDRLFRSRFGGDYSVVGRPLLLGQAVYTVVGIAPPDVRLPIGPLVRRGLGAPTDPDVLIPIPAVNATVAIGRLRAGVSPTAAREELAARRLTPPAGQPGSAVHVRLLEDQIVGNVRATLLFLWGACVLVLLIASVNVAGLLLARSAGRRRELAVRAALGASRLRIARHLFAETLILAVAGAAAGLALALFIVRALRASPELAVPRLNEVAVDAPVAAFAAGLCLLTAMAAGLLPMVLDSRIPAAAVLTDGGRQTTSRRRAQRTLVVVQLALALTLTTAAWLMIRSLSEARSNTRPLDAAAVLSARVEPYDARLSASQADRQRFAETLVARLESLPHVSAAALWSVPYIFAISVEGIPAAEAMPPAALWVAVTPHFGAASGVPVVSGRWLGSDQRDAHSVVVSETFAKQLPSAFQKQLLGRRIQGPSGTDTPGWTIVGVVRDFRTGVGNGASVDNDAQLFPQVFFLNNGLMATNDLLVRSTEPDAFPLTPAVGGVVRGFGRVSFLEPRTLDDQIAAAIAPRRLMTTMLAGFASVAVFLATLGFAGLLTYSVSTRTREIGVRVAVGASTFDVIRLVLADAALIVSAGAVAGWIGAAVVARAMAGLLYRVDPIEPSAYIVGLTLLVATVVIGTLGPARRAVCVDPVEAMRNA